MIRMGGIELHVVGDGTFRLDGGAMFGIVPRAAWEKRVVPDSRNRILLGLNLLLIRTGGRNILVETGLGDKHDARFADLYSVDRSLPAPEGLRRIGVGTGDIDMVILTHLHLDHAGGATTRREGKAVPTFPRAVYVIQEGACEEALRDNPRTRGSYRPEDFLPLREAGLVRFVRGDEEVAPGVRVLRTGGHVGHHQMVMVEGGGRKAAFWGDLLPSTVHVKPAWVTGYDLYPAELASLKEDLLGRSASEGWLNVFGHDPQIAVGVLRREEDGFRVEAVERAPCVR